MKVSVGQFAPTGSLEDNLETIARLVAKAKAESADLVLFPEEAMLAVSQVSGPLNAAIEGNWSTFVQKLSFMAAENNIAIVAGGYESSGEERPYNTLAVLDATGEILGTYRKIHLYDAFSYQESKSIKAGDVAEVPVFEIAGLKVGVLTCYDLRFPEIARRLVNEGAELLLVAAAWFKGEHKIEHWETLLRARAIENTVWVAAAGTSSQHTIGHSAILDPMGVPVEYLGDDDEGLVTTDVTRRRIDEVREFLPVLANRRL
ncbi:carbon-nitrogen hydrolase family protein [Paeniglutamicibacter terrestris]|uniref:Carbon-nitrogen hydrolase family protein n=1 Tax=Paeniglutamicibacter terrestris TaxID=2723403 RepID=A0ABX1G704_9MICC|nr:carbon-nitrogen hydrolase family protein [Paeniglutamicibacter terrestris]ASN40701.1 carbon-nitrogen hydrolase [Arthrobacter sp. 7749]NKG21197.1 carbon-nitrogen hydrolase family protein [Paeniglutamicibacter terrestris]